MASRPIEQARTLFPTQQQPGRILEVRHDVEKPHSPPFEPETAEDRVEIVEVDAVRLLGDADHFRLNVSEGRDRTRVRGQLDQHDVARIAEDPRHEVQPLLRPGRHKELFSRDGDSSFGEDFSQGLEQRSVAARRAVLQDGAVLSTQEVGGDRPELAPGEHRWIRKARRERDDVPAVRRHAPHLPDRGLLHPAGGA